MISFAFITILEQELDGRNATLFRTDCYMCDEGYSLPDVVAVLAACYAHQSRIHPHPTATYAEEYVELFS